MDPSDEQLIADIRTEHPYATRAFEQFLQRYEPMVYRTCLRYLGNPQEAEEATQDAFLRVYHGARGFSGRSTVKTWLYRIVANVCATRYQKLRKQSMRQEAYRQSMIESYNPTNPQTADQPSPATNPADLVEGPVAEALTLLAEKDKQIILLRHVSELSVPEVSEVLQIKLSAAKMRLSRAEQRLREVYEERKGKNPSFMKNL